MQVKVVDFDIDGNELITEEEFVPSVDEEYEKAKKIHSHILRMEELRKDFEQERLGLIVPDLEEKQAEYISLLQEVRVLQGKQEREVRA